VMDDELNILPISSHTQSAKRNQVTNNEVWVHNSISFICMSSVPF
jgi:hypothetical protein